MASFPRTHRLTKPAEFQHVFERGRHRRIQVTGLTARVREGAEPYARLGFALSKRSLKRAVDRNRVRRVVREYFRLQYTQLPTVDIVIMSQNEVAAMSNTVILQQLDILWQRLRKLYPPPQDTVYAERSLNNPR